MRDIPEIFVYNRGFSGSGYRMMPDKFYHDQTPLPWQRNLGVHVKLFCAIVSYRLPQRGHVHVIIVESVTTDADTI